MRNKSGIPIRGIDKNYTFRNALKYYYINNMPTF